MKPCDDLDGASRRNNAENLELRKRKDEATWNQEFLPHEQTLEEGIHLLDETKIRITLYLSFTNLDWWQATDLAYYLFS